MTCPNRNRSRLLLGCGSAALALALSLPQRAEAQGIQADSNVVVGSAEIVNTGPNDTVIDLFGPTTVIDWTPFEDVNGDALTFLPQGSTATFQSSSISNFAVLNRILPSTNGNVMVINGSVISRVFDISGGQVPGGFVAFYSPTGILIGSTATFDVGSLMLTTLEPDLASFQNFAEIGGTMSLAATPGSTARIQIDPGAQIAATAENSFFAVVAADVQMLGTALINGSHAYVAGEVVNLNFSNGLFDITVPVGTAAGGTVIDINGTVGGPSSTGVGDNHMIYAVARAQNDPISMLFSGNLGFDPAQSAGVVNGEIILAANHDVFGRFVNGGVISDGIDAIFAGNSGFPDVRADIFIQDFAATSSLLAIGTHRTQVSALNAASSVAGNLLIVGRENAELTASNGQSLTITGDVLVSATDYGVLSSSLQSLDEINAQGGIAFIDAFGGGSIAIGGSARVAADAFAGADDLNGVAGSAQGGQALIGSTGGSLSITGDATVSAGGYGPLLDGLLTGAVARGGLAQVFATQGGQVTFGGDVLVIADAVGTESFSSAPLSASDAFGGQAIINIFDGGGLIDIAGFAVVSADARGGDSNNAGAGSVGAAGSATVTVDGPGVMNFASSLTLTAFGAAGDNIGGTGGIGRGGRASAATFGGGAIAIAGDFSADASGNGGSGQNGGDAFGGIAGANAVTGSISIGGAASAESEGEGGDASEGFGGNGGTGRGGNSFFQANGTLTESASLTIALGAFLSSDGFGGQGGESDGQAIAAGRGGDGIGGDFSTPNQADPNFNSGTFLLAGGDNATLTVGGSAFLSASGFGGSGGFSGGALPGGQGGNGFGGLAQAGLALLAGDGSLGLGSATFASLFVAANGFGGSGGISFDEIPTGNGGDGTGGRALLQASAGDVIADTVTLFANGFGGDGAQGGDGTGGERSGTATNTGGSITLGNFAAYAHGAGGTGFGLGGGNGFGGQAFMGFQGGTTVVNGDVIVDATGFGGTAFDGGTGGTGTGGIADLAIFTAVTGSGTITGNAAVVANGIGGAAGSDGLRGGDGFGGRAFIQSQAGGTIRIGSAQVTASGLGGGQNDGVGLVTGGNGTGGSAELLSSGSGSQLIIENNTPNDFTDLANAGAIVAALGIGGSTTGGTGIGGSGTGGTVLLSAIAGGSIALPSNPAGDPNSAPFIGLNARGFGGGSEVEGGSGGTGTGGFGIIEADAGGTITMGSTNFTVFGVGGSSLNSGLNISGGEGIGGERLIRITNGAELTAALAFGTAGARGGNGSGSGNGGNASSGRNSLEVIDATLNIVGNFLVFDQAIGGNGQQGGSATGGTAEFLAENATINFIPDANGNSSLLVSADATGGNGVDAGGDAVAGNVAVRIDGSDLNAGNIRITAAALGGNASGPGGIGGNATAGSATFTATGSTIELLGENEISADAIGGIGGTQGSNGSGGNAASGVVTVNFTNSQVTIGAGSSGPGILRLGSRADGGDGDQMGDALSNIARLQLSGGSLIADEIGVEAFGFANANTAGQLGGTAEGGSAEIVLQGNAVLDTGLIELISNAGTSLGGTARAGQSVLRILADSAAQVQANDIVLTADAFGGDAAQGASTAGRIGVEVRGGTVNTGTLTGSALGDVLSAQAQPSTLVGDGGSLLVSGLLSLNTLGNILVRSGQGGIVGGPTVASPTAQIVMTSQGTIRFEGDNDNVIGFGGQTMRLSAREIDITEGARIGAEVVDFISLDTQNTAILGGTTEEAGFTLTAAEAARIEAGEFTFFGPSIVSSDPNLADILIRDITVLGSLDDGTSAIRIFGDSFDGIVRIEGTVSYNGAALTDLFSISARRIEVVTPGGIRIQDLSGRPGGILSLGAADIWAADADTIAQLQANRSFEGRDALLAVAAAGSDDPLGYLRANRVELGIGNSLLVRNTGVAFAGGGILVGDGQDAGLSIFSAGSQSSAGSELDVVAYGRRQLTDGTFITGADFFNEVNFDRASGGSTTYLEASAFNDCVINTGDCPQPPPPPPPPTSSKPELAPVNNPTVILDPVTFGDPTGESPEEQDEKFGMDFPERPEASLISEQPLLDDPVTSGSDASLYAASGDAPGKEN